MFCLSDRFVSCARPKLDGCHVCEVGPGPGSITRRILQKGAEKLTVIEKDRRFLPILQVQVCDDLSLVNAFVRL